PGSAVDVLSPTHPGPGSSSTNVAWAHSSPPSAAHTENTCSATTHRLRHDRVLRGLGACQRTVESENREIFSRYQDVEASAVCDLQPAQRVFLQLNQHAMIYGLEPAQRISLACVSQVFLHGFPNIALDRIGET